MTGRARDVEQEPARLRREVGQQQSRQDGQRGDVDGDLVGDAVGILLDEVARGAEPGGVDEGLGAPASVAEALPDGGGRTGGGEIGGDHHGADAARGLEPGGQGIQAVRAAGDQREVVPAACQSLGQGSAESRARAGDHGDGAGGCVHGGLFVS